MWSCRQNHKSPSHSCETSTPSRHSCITREHEDPLYNCILPIGWYESVQDREGGSHLAPQLMEGFHSFTPSHELQVIHAMKVKIALECIHSHPIQSSPRSNPVGTPNPCPPSSLSVRLLLMARATWWPSPVARGSALWHFRFMTQQTPSYHRTHARLELSKDIFMQYFRQIRLLTRPNYEQWEAGDPHRMTLK